MVLRVPSQLFQKVLKGAVRDFNRWFEQFNGSPFRKGHPNRCYYRDFNTEETIWMGQFGTPESITSFRFLISLTVVEV